MQPSVPPEGVEFCDVVDGPCPRRRIDQTSKLRVSDGAADLADAHQSLAAWEDALHHLPVRHHVHVRNGRRYRGSALAEADPGSPSPLGCWQPLGREAALCCVLYSLLRSALICSLRCSLRCLLRCSLLAAARCAARCAVRCALCAVRCALCAALCALLCARCSVRAALCALLSALLLSALGKLLVASCAVLHSVLSAPWSMRPSLTAVQFKCLASARQHHVFEKKKTMKE